jgi:hypothetical protein
LLERQLENDFSSLTEAAFNLAAAANLFKAIL